MTKNVKAEGLPVRIRANREEEEFILGNHFDIAMPIFIRVLQKDGIYIECYPQVEEAVRAHVALYGERILSNQSLRALHEALAPYLSAWHYAPEKNSMRRYDIYRSTGESDPHPRPTGVRALTEEDEEKNRTTQDIAYALQNGALAFGYEENGEILSIAATHLYDEEWPHDVEVMVETVPRARGRGLALACLRALKEELRLLGHGLEYRASTRNAPSGSVARRAGLLHCGQCYYYVLRAK